VTSVYDHYRATESTGLREGVYRVVGVNEDEDTVTLLLVADADGERIHTGKTISVKHSQLDEVETASNPDADRSSVDAIASVPETAYWSVHAFADQAASRPFLSSVALASVVFGFLGGGVAFLSDSSSGLLILVGSLALMYVGSGRI
jgi:hypothetical protein